MSKVFDTIMLAAGLSERFGSNKLLTSISGTTVLGLSLKKAVKAGTRILVVVVSGNTASESEKFMSGLQTDGSIIHILINDNPAMGMRHSLFLGVDCLERLNRHLTDDPVYSCSEVPVCIALGDKPLVKPGSYTDILESLEKSGSPVAVPEFNGLHGHPVFSSNINTVKELCSELTPDSSGDNIRQLFHKAACFHKTTDPGTVFDIDTPEDLLKHLEISSGRTSALVTGDDLQKAHRNKPSEDTNES